MLFHGLPGFSHFAFYPFNSLLLLSHIPVERRSAELRNCANAKLRDLSARVDSATKTLVEF
jgi:hypothetical protein